MSSVDLLQNSHWRNYLLCWFEATLWKTLRVKFLMPDTMLNAVLFVALHLTTLWGHHAVPRWNAAAFRLSAWVLCLGVRESCQWWRQRSPSRPQVSLWPSPGSRKNEHWCSEENETLISVFQKPALSEESETRQWEGGGPVAPPTCLCDAWSSSSVCSENA